MIDAILYGLTLPFRLMYWVLKGFVGLIALLFSIAVIIILWNLLNFYLTDPEVFWYTMSIVMI
jgi:hypothetical protein